MANNSNPNLKIHIGGDTSDVEKKVKGLQKLFSSFSHFMKTAAVSGFTALAAAAGKVIGDMIKMTQKFGDQWDIAVEGMKGAYGAFVRGLARGEGFSELFANIKKAGEMARQAAAEMDDLFERKNSATYKETSYDAQIAQLNLIARDQSRTDEERQAAAERIIELENELGKMKTDIAKQEQHAARLRLKSQTQLSDMEIDYIIRDREKNKDMVEAANEYLEARKRINAEITKGESLSLFTGGRQGGTIIASANAEMKDLEANTSAGVKAVAKMVQAYDSGYDDIVTAVVEADNAVLQITADTAKAQTRAVALVGSLKNKTTTGNTSEYNSDQNAIKKIQDSFKTEEQLYEEHFQQNLALFEKYGLDTSQLMSEHLMHQMGLTEEALNSISNAVDSYEVPTLEPFVIEADNFDQLDAYFEKLREQEQEAESLAQAFTMVVAAGFSDGIQTMTDQLMGLDEMNPGAIFQALITPLADMAVREGEILVASGLGIEAIKTALSSLNGIAAIAAGATLIAIGSFAKSAMSSLASTGSYSTTSSVASSTSGYTSSSTLAQQEVNVRVTGTLQASGSSLVAVLNNEQNRKSHTT